MESRTLMQPAESVRPRPRLDGALTTGEAVRTVLRWLLATIRANERGVLTGKDPVHLHDFRVAVRRTRTVLGQFEGVPQKAEARRFRRDLKWLGRCTGPVRDLDVWIETIPRFARSLESPARRELPALVDLLVAKRARARGALVDALRSARYADLVEEWAKVLSAASPVWGVGEAARRPIREVASARIGRAYRKVLAEGRRVTAESSPGELHGLRIRCKKLRYLLEFFGSLYAPDALDDSIATLKALQDRLGDFNDYSVQRRLLSSVAAEFERGDAGEAARRGLDAALEAAQERERGRIGSESARFDSDRNHGRFRELCAGG